MAKQVINTGTAANSKNGDPLRTAFTKVNANFTELYASIGGGSVLPGFANNSGKFLTTNGTSAAWGAVDYNSLTNLPTFAAVATTGSYTNLSNRPTLATVATSGSFADLSEKPTISTLLPTQSGNTGKFLYTDGANVAWQTTASDPIPTNQFFVDPYRTHDYTPTGTISKPYWTIAAALTAIDTLITAGTIVPAETNPVFVVLCGSITENVTLTKGHIFLTSFNGGIHTPIYLFGTITINGANSTTSALDANHFSIEGLSINAPAQQACIYFTGTNAQRLMVKDLWLTATGSQTGSTPFTNAGGYGIYADCTGIRASDGHKSSIHGNDIKVSHNGTGDVYCFKIGSNAGTARVTADFNNVETSGATQVAAVGSGCTLGFANSELDANGETCVEVYGLGQLSITGSTIQNVRTSAESYGIWLHASTSACVIMNSVIDVWDLTSSHAGSRAIKSYSGATAGQGGYVFYNNIMIGKDTTTFTDHNKYIDNVIVYAPLTVGLTTTAP